MLALNPHLLAISPSPGGLSEGRGFIDRALSAAGFDAGTRYQVTVATNEAVSNAMEHGVPCDDGHIHLAATVEDGSFVFSVRDCGEFEPAAAPTPDPVAERGRGLIAHGGTVPPSEAFCTRVASARHRPKGV